MVLNFYPYLQKYIAPHTKDVTMVLAALVGAVHELVPPETLQPVLRQLVDQFVHDKWVDQSVHKKGWTGLSMSAS